MRAGTKGAAGREWRDVHPDVVKLAVKLFRPARPGVWARQGCRLVRAGQPEALRRRDVRDGAAGHPRALGPVDQQPPTPPSPFILLWISLFRGLP